MGVFFNCVKYFCVLFDDDIGSIDFFEDDNDSIVLLDDG